MKQYELYKDSGIQWIGKIPSHWNVLPLKYYISFTKGRIPSETTDKCIGDPYLTMDYLRDRNDKQVVYPNNPDGLPLMNEGDILVLWDGANAGEFIKSKRGYLGSTMAKISFDEEIYDKSYLYYLLCSIEPISKEFANGTTIPHFDSKVLLDYAYPCPNLVEQQAIVSYLDFKVGQIEDTIAEKELMLDEFKSYRLAIISEVITKGLDKNVKMKDSGSNTIGCIPESWKVMKTLYCLSMPITDGPHTTPELYEKGIPFISAEAVSCGNGKIDFSHMRGYISQEFYEECCKKYIPQKDDIYMIKSGATTGKVAIVDTDRLFTIWSPLAVFRCNRKIMLPNYLFFLLQSSLYQAQVELGWSFGTQQNIGMRVLEKIQIPVPAIEEQQKISDYLIIKNVEIEKAIKLMQDQIDDLKTYKYAIITEAVTGKMDLRDWKLKK